MRSTSESLCSPASAAGSTVCSASVVTFDPGLGASPAPDNCADAGDDDDDEDETVVARRSDSDYGNAAPDSSSRSDDRAPSCEPDWAIWLATSRRSTDLMKCKNKSVLNRDSFDYLLCRLLTLWRSLRRASRSCLVHWYDLTMLGWEWQAEVREILDRYLLFDRQRVKRYGTFNRLWMVTTLVHTC